MSNQTMSNRDSLGQGTELLPIPNRHKSAYHSLKSASSGDAERGPRQSSSEDDEAQSNPKRRIFRDGARFEGWKFTVFLAFIISLIVLFFNIGFLLYTAIPPRQDDPEPYAIEYQSGYYWGADDKRNTVLYEGDCEKVHRLTTGFRLLVNLLSTAILSASNFGMV